jgi:hypothetical protein
MKREREGGERREEVKGERGCWDEERERKSAERKSKHQTALLMKKK